MTGDDRIWMIEGGSDRAAKLASGFATCMHALDMVIAKHGEFRAAWDPADGRCPSPEQLSALKKLLALLVIDLLSGATLTVMRADPVTALTAWLGLPPETGLLLREAYDAGQHD